MATLKETLKQTHDWSLVVSNNFVLVMILKRLERRSIRQEFMEWFDKEKETNVLSLEYIDDFGSGVDIIEI